MKTRRLMAILGTTLLVSVGKVSVSYAQGQGTAQAASETAPTKDNASSKTDAPPDIDAISKTSGGSRTGLVGRFIGDQREIWTSPAKLRFSDTEWLVPLSGITAGLMVTDRDFSKHLSHNPSTISRYNNLSNASVGALIGGAAGMWLLSHATHNEHWRETGLLAGEAALNSLVVVEGLKYPLGRRRPFQGNGSGDFFQGGTSFPSEHAAAAWSVAGVIAHEYPGPLTKLFVYGLAATVDFSRVRARQHFPSDVFVGSLIGNLVAQNIYSRHHDPELGGDNWRSIREIFRGDGSSSPANIGSPYVPLDNWVYPVFDRLIALGYINQGFLGQRPWTRQECAYLVGEASDKLGEDNSNSAGSHTSVDDLEQEFAIELKALAGGSDEQLRIESIYTQARGIDGQPLADSYHFGQTIINNYGRPYQEGFNSDTGFSAFATHGRYSLYVRGEFQHAPSAPAQPLAARQAIATVDQNPLQPAAPVPEVNQFDLLDTFVGVTLENWELTFGKQSLWWGPGHGGALLFSNNADPIYMFRASRVTPFTLPWLFRKMGPVKLDFFFGKLSGNEFPPRPLIHGEKISFKPTPNLEFGFSRTSRSEEHTSE